MKECEALTLALEALESYEKSAYIKQSHPKRWANGKKVITAIKEALAQPEQAPVAWITQKGKGWLRWHKPEDNNADSVPLYTTPPQRTWVGLTDEDLANCDDTELKQALYWEQILKEKNT